MGLRKQKGLRITDATAQPINVGDGLVFYNNDGRQVGIKTDGDITDISIPVGTSFVNDGTTYNYVYAANIKSFDMSQTPHTIDAPGFYDGSKANIDKYQENGRFTIGKKHSVKTNIIVSDIKQFTIKIGGYNYDVKFGQNFYNLTKKVLANFRNSSGNPVYITQPTGTDYVPYILFDIQNGVIKEIGFGVKSTGTITTNVKVDVHVNTVQRSIIDATAVPSDVAQGKVFYNNDGRQVGTLLTYGKEVITLKKTTVLASTNRSPIVYTSDTQVIGSTNVSSVYASDSSNVSRNVNINKKCVIKTSFRDRTDSIVSENIFFPRNTHDIRFGIHGQFEDFNATDFYVVFNVANDAINQIYLAVNENYQSEHEMLSDIIIEIKYF